MRTEAEIREDIREARETLKKHPVGSCGWCRTTYYIDGLERALREEEAE